MNAAATSTTFYRLETYLSPERLGYEPRRGHFAIVSHFDFRVDKHKFVAPLAAMYVFLSQWHQQTISDKDTKESRG